MPIRSQPASNVFWLPVAVLLALLLGTVPAAAQSVEIAPPADLADPGAVSLTFARIAEEGDRFIDRQPWDAKPGTRVLVLSASGESQPHTLDNLGVSRDDLIERIGEAKGEDVQTLTEGTTTPQLYAKTATANRIYYVLARTPGGTLYESYVPGPAKASFGYVLGFVPGFDAVATGKMTMGRVPQEHRADFEAAFQAASQNTPPEAPGVSNNEASSESGTSAATEDKSFFVQWGPSIIGIFVVLLVLAIGTAWVVKTRKKGQEESQSRESSNPKEKGQARPDPTGVQQAHENVDRLHKEMKIKRLTLENEQLRTKVETLQQNIDRLRERIEGAQPQAATVQRLEAENEEYRDEIQHLRARLDAAPADKPSDRTDALSTAWASIDPPRPGSDSRSSRDEWGYDEERNSGGDRRTVSPAPTPTTPDPTPPPHQSISEAFVEWCNREPAMMDRNYMFSNHLKEAESGASVEVVEREQNEHGIIFTDNARDPVEYWKVTMDGDAWVYPQPRRGGFRELDPCFEGDATPQTIRKITPATLQRDGSRYVLDQKGTVR